MEHPAHEYKYVLTYRLQTIYWTPSTKASRKIHLHRFLAKGDAKARQEVRDFLYKSSRRQPVKLMREVALRQ